MKFLVLLFSAVLAVNLGIAKAPSQKKNPLPKEMAAQKKYPRVIAIRGEVTINSSEGVLSEPKVGTLLRGVLSIQVKAHSQLRIQMDPFRALFVEPETEIRIPGISWETGELTEIQLKSGRIRVRSDKSGPFAIDLTSDLFTHIWPLGDIVFEFIPKAAQTTVYVIFGSLNFSALNSEEKIQLQTGQKVRFQGQIENEEIAYDILLQGRKVAKGQLGPVESLSPEENSLWDLTLELARLKALNLAEKKNKEKQNQLQPGQVCKGPQGKLNDCAWICRNNPSHEKKKCLLQNSKVFCERVRCLAQGEWGDPYKLSREEAQVRCQIKPQVSACNY